MTKRLLAVAALVLLTTGALAGVTGASSHGSKSSAVSQGKLGVRNGVIYGCVETHGSKQTLGDLKLANCHKGFKAIAWNIRGPKGARGVGTPGPQGPQGPQGSQGSDSARALRALRATDVPGDRLEALVAVGELQIAERLIAAMCLHAPVDDPVSDAEPPLTHGGRLRALA